MGTSINNTQAATGWRKLSAITLSTPSTTLADFTNITAGYKFFKLIGYAVHADTAKSGYIAFNGNAPSALNQISGEGASVSSSAGPWIYVTATELTIPIMIEIVNSAVVAKSFMSNCGGPSRHTRGAGWWNSATEINQLTLTSNGTINSGYVELWGSS